MRPDAAHGEPGLGGLTQLDVLSQIAVGEM